MKARRNILTTLCVAALALTAAARPARADLILDYKSFFDVFTTEDSVALPPYPSSSSPPVKVKVSTGPDPSRTVDIEIVAMSLKRVNLIPLPGGLPSPGETTLKARDSGGPLGTAGLDSFFDVVVDLPSPGQPYRVYSFFDVFFDITAPDGTRGRLIPGRPTAPNGLVSEQAAAGDSFFDVFFDIDYGPGGIASHHLHGEIGADQPATFTGVATGFNVDSFFDVFTEISLDGAPADGPLFSMSMTGNWTPEPATLTLLGAGSIVALLKRRRRRR